MSDTSKDIVIYGVIGSPFVRAIEVGLAEKGAQYHLHAMGPTDTKSAEHLARHPFGRVPAFRHGDFALYETQAILRYLDDVFPRPPLVPADPRAAARMNQIIGINDWYLFPKAAAPIVFQRLIGPVLLGTTTDEAAVAAAVPMAKTCVAELDRLLGAQRFLAGETLSIADIILAPQLDFFAATPEGRKALEGTGLKAWLARMNARPSMIATQRPEALRGAA
jgi:glutathione S-transferase